jgi:hypothetical protein
MQLDLLLKTLLLNCKDIQELSDINVLYTTNKEDHEKSYGVLRKEYKNINFVKEVSFKQDLLNLLKNRKNVLFLVDDSVVVKKFLLKEILFGLNSIHGALGFSLRLGKNTVNCYPLNKEQNVPLSVCNCKSEWTQYYWPDVELDFGYPLELSSSCYRVKDLLPLLENCSFNNPNSLESVMALNVEYYNEKPILLCFKNSVCFSDPLNKVQNFNGNRSGNVSPEGLLLKFEEGYRINIESFKGFISSGAHQYVPVEFIKVKDD